MSSFDYILLTPVLIGLLRGLMRGFIKELMALISVAAGVLAAKFFAGAVQPVLTSVFSIPDTWALWLAYILLFFGVMVLCTLLRAVITKLIDSLDLGCLNRICGGVFGALKWALVVSVCLNLLMIVEDKFCIIKPEVKEQSVVYKPMLKLASVAWQYAPVAKEETTPTDTNENAGEGESH